MVGKSSRLIVGSNEDGWDRQIDTARQTFPLVQLSPAVFSAHLANLFPEYGLDECGRELDLQGIFLACACAHGDQGAISTFEQVHMGEVDRVYYRLKPALLDRDDARQLVRMRLLLPTGGLLPRIATYRGRGGLGSWTRVVATRTLMNATDRKRVNPSVEDSFVEAVTRASGRSELMLLRQLYGDTLSIALRRAVAGLNEEDRLILRWELSGLSAAEIGRIQQTHPRTMQRRVGEVHARVAAAFQAELSEVSRICLSDAQSLLRVMITQLSIGRL